MNNKLETISNLFEGNEIRSIWDSEKEEYYFSVVDVVSTLTDSKNPNDYWYRLKTRMTDEEKSELSTKCRQLKLKSGDGKYRETDALDTNIEIALTNVGEIAARDIAITEKPQGLKQNLKVAKRGGGVAKGARDLYEKETKKSALSNKNNLIYKYVNEEKQIENAEKSSE